ncbi:hypothetical protein CC2G_001033 [Coprinopsis cinerea AmutBmut pab1-1]|nr:hypothetical protein CC2G_001033 [Coprinopsis cinerea AmutBmut pab1-1]
MRYVPKTNHSSCNSWIVAQKADAKGRRIQNRAAQRAFRERKQSQLAELQARILSYEQGEIERNVALQKIAKRLKEENDRLLQENIALKERLAQAEQKAKAAEADKKRPREESPKAHTQAKKRAKSSMTPGIAPESPVESIATASSQSPEPIPTPADNSQPTSQSASFPQQYDINVASLGGILDFSSAVKVDTIQQFPPFDCGFCSDNTPCVCRDMLGDFKADTFVGPTSLVSFEPSPSSIVDTPLEPSNQPAPPPPAPSSSILDNLPAYQPPVPLRRRTTRPLTKPIFPVFPLSSDSEGQGAGAPTCSGDPSNCAACGDDSFGQAFCAAIEETVMSQERCGNCPGRKQDGDGSSSCCGVPMFCRGCPLAPGQQPGTSADIEDYIPTNKAWQQIKEHPNVQFADLALLAEVVASRSKCTGPRIVTSPAPEVQQQESKFSHAGGSNPPRLVPQEILLECGRRRVREVHSEAVRDALRLLDAKFT